MEEWLLTFSVAFTATFFFNGYKQEEGDTLVSQEWLSREAARTRWRSRRNSSTTGTMWVWMRTWCASWERTCYSRSVRAAPGTGDPRPPCPPACLRSPCPRETPPGCFVACCLITTATSSGASRWRTLGKGPDTVLYCPCVSHSHMYVGKTQCTLRWWLMLWWRLLLVSLP